MYLLLIYQPVFSTISRYITRYPVHNFADQYIADIRYLQHWLHVTSLDGNMALWWAGESAGMLDADKLVEGGRGYKPGAKYIQNGVKYNSPKKIAPNIPSIFRLFLHDFSITIYYYHWKEPVIIHIELMKNGTVGSKLTFNFTDLAFYMYLEDMK